MEEIATNLEDIWSDLGGGGRGVGVCRREREGGREGGWLESIERSRTFDDLGGHQDTVEVHTLSIWPFKGSDLGITVERFCKS